MTDGNDRPDNRQDWQSGVTPLRSRYSLFVNRTKILLPLLAVGLVGVLFVWPFLNDGKDPDQGFGFLDVNVNKNEQAMVNPRYVGTNVHEQPFTVTADVAALIGDEKDLVRLDVIRAEMQTRDRGKVYFRAPSGLYQTAVRTLSLEGNITVTADFGYRFNAGRTEVDLNQGTATSSEKVDAASPFGAIEANSFNVAADGNIVQFNGQVKAIFVPQETY